MARAQWQEAEQVPSVVDPLVDRGAREEEAPCSAEMKYNDQNSIAAKISQGSTWVKEKGGAATATGLVWVTSDISSSSGFLRPALTELVGGRV